MDTTTDLAQEVRDSVDVMDPEMIRDRLIEAEVIMEENDRRNNRELLDQNRQVVEEFAGLLCDLGIQVQLMDVISRELFGKTVSENGEIPDGAVPTPVDMLRTAMNDLMNVGLFGDISFEFENAVNAAVSLEWLVRYARKLDSRVFPCESIPDDNVVGACLKLFHYERKLSEAIETTESEG